MGNNNSQSNIVSGQNDIAIEDAFRPNELHLLRALYEDLARRNEQPEVDKATFLDFFAVPKLLGERLFQVFDYKRNGVIDLDEFLTGLSTYAKGTMERKMEMLFMVYDLNDEKAVNKEELRMMLFSLVSPDSKNAEEELYGLSKVNSMSSFNGDPDLPILSNNQSLPATPVTVNVGDKVRPVSLNLPDQLVSQSEIAYRRASGDTGSNFSIGPVTDAAGAINSMVDDAFEECDLDRSEKLSLDQWKLFVKKHPALIENLEYVLLGSVYDFIHPENIGLGDSMADHDEYNVALFDDEDDDPQGLRLQLVAEDLRHIYKCEESNVEVWVGGPPKELSEDPEVTQISLVYHGTGPFIAETIKFCPFTGQELKYVKEDMTEKVHIENINPQRKRKKVIKQGELWIKKKWNKMESKYYVINGPFLYCFANSDTSKPFESASYILGFFIEPITRSERNKYGIKLVPPAGSRNVPLTLFADDTEERSSWIQALRKAAKTGKIEDHYELMEKIGSGQFSDVLKAANLETGEEVAVKKINKSKLDAREKESIQNEIAICQLVSHPNVIRLKEVYETQRSMYLVMPLLFGDLFAILKKKKRLGEDTAKRITWKLLDALKYLHALGIVHRDLKPENILIKSEDDETDIVIADFGLSKFAMPHERLQLACGTVAYVAPEVLRMRGYDKKCDLWSVGVILYLMLRGKLPFDSNLKKEIIKMTLSRPANLADNYWRTISNAPKNLISKLLKKTPENRIELSVAQAHVWFDDVRDELSFESGVNPQSPNVGPRIAPNSPPAMKQAFQPPNYANIFRSQGDSAGVQEVAEKADA